MIKDTVLITGASSGIGRSFAKIFAKNGYNLFLIALEQELLESLAEELKRTYQIDVLILSIDLSSNGAAQKIVDFMNEHNWEAEIIINNAGFGCKGDFYRMPIHKIHEMIAVNMTALVELTRLLLPEMIRRNYGKILNTASTAAFQPGPGMAVYFATKAFIASFSQALSSELSHTNITVTTLCPGPTKTNFAKLAGLYNNPIHQGIVPILEADDVAECGYKMMMRGKRLVIVGLMNKICSFISFLMPSSLVMNSIKKLHSK